MGRRIPDGPEDPSPGHTRQENLHPGNATTPENRPDRRFQAERATGSQHARSSPAMSPRGLFASLPANQACGEAGVHAAQRAMLRVDGDGRGDGLGDGRGEGWARAQGLADARTKLETCTQLLFFGTSPKTRVKSSHLDNSTLFSSCNSLIVAFAWALYTLGIRTIPRRTDGTDGLYLLQQAVGQLQFSDLGCQAE